MLQQHYIHMDYALTMFPTDAVTSLSSFLVKFNYFASDFRKLHSLQQHCHLNIRQQLPEEAPEGEEAGVRRIGRRRRRYLLCVEHDGVADLATEGLDGPRVDRSPRGVADVEHVHCLLPDRRHVGPRHRQAVLAEHSRHIRQQAHPVAPADLQAEALHCSTAYVG